VTCRVKCSHFSMGKSSQRALENRYGSERAVSSTIAVERYVQARR
jgi:hypothetical protein